MYETKPTQTSTEHSLHNWPKPQARGKGCVAVSRGLRRDREHMTDFRRKLENRYKPDRSKAFRKKSVHPQTADCAACGKRGSKSPGTTGAGTVRDSFLVPDLCTNMQYRWGVIRPSCRYNTASETHSSWSRTRGLTLHKLSDKRGALSQFILRHPERQLIVGFITQFCCECY